MDAVTLKNFLLDFFMPINQFAKFIIFVLLVTLLGCEKSTTELNGIPEYLHCKNRSFREIDNVSVLEMSISSEYVMNAVEYYDSALSRQWRKVSIDTLSLRDCLQHGGHCQGEILWEIPGKSGQIHLMVVGASKSPGCSLAFSRFSSEYK